MNLLLFIFPNTMPENSFSLTLIIFPNHEFQFLGCHPLFYHTNTGRMHKGKNICFLRNIYLKEGGTVLGVVPKAIYILIMSSTTESKTLQPLQVWEHMPLIAVLKRQRQFKASLVYKLSSRITRATQNNPVLKKTKYAELKNLFYKKSFHFPCNTVAQDSLELKSLIL